MEFFCISLGSIFSQYKHLDVLFVNVFGYLIWQIIRWPCQSLSFGRICFFFKCQSLPLPLASFCVTKLVVILMTQPSTLVEFDSCYLWYIQNHVFVLIVGYRRSQLLPQQWLSSCCCWICCCCCDNCRVICPYYVS